MLLYEYRIRDEFERVKQMAERLKSKAKSNGSFDELFIDTENLSSLFKILEEILPQELHGISEFQQHHNFCIYYLKKENSYNYLQNISCICDNDLPLLESKFRDWCSNSIHYDKEIVEKTTNLLVRREYDSVVRKAFVILKSRLVKKFNIANDIDGEELVNKIFGSNGLISRQVDQNECQSMRNLLSGMYGIFRNNFSHNDVEIHYHEVDAILSMINYILKCIDKY